MHDVGDGGVRGGDVVDGFVEGGGDEGWGKGGLEKEGEGEAEEEEGCDEGFGLVHDGIVLAQRGRRFDRGVEVVRS